MQDKETIARIEKQIDDSFARSKLMKAGYTQAIWTLLSVNEDYFLKVLNQLPEEEQRIFADVHMNALTYPLRVCLHKATEGTSGLRKELINDDYQLALDWLEASRDYSQYCTLFPYWHRGRIDVAIEGTDLKVHYPTSFTREYEAYNRLVHKEGKSDAVIPKVHGDLLDLLRAATTAKNDMFYVKFNPKLVSALVSTYWPVFSARFSLPDHWAFGGFRLPEYRDLYLTLQSMLAAWVSVRDILAQQKMPGLGYRSAVWVVAKQELIARLARYTGIAHSVVEKILHLITFGSSGIRFPDIATQPLVDLHDGTFALAPFVWLNSSAERNLCALLNKIPEQKSIYSALTDEKEEEMRDEIVEFLSPFGLEFEHGEVTGTDLDLAVIDRKNKVCLCPELKWFIEPAGVREIVERSNDLTDGIEQAGVINRLHKSGDKHLLRDVLCIDDGYKFLAAVVSRNWIGHDEIQSPNVPIIKVWHLLNKITDCGGSLLEPLIWLKNREYLPKHGVDYSVETLEISCGDWRANWFGIKPLGSQPHVHHIRAATARSSGPTAST
jgi:hypothetical protein